MRRLFLAATLLALPAFAADISGSWTFTGDVAGNPLNMKCAFKQEADKVTGSCTHQGMGASATSGGVTANKVTFQHQVNTGETYDLSFTGTLDAAATAMNGEISVAGITGTFSGTKDPAVTDISGKWTITGDVVGNAINMKCDLKRDGDKVTGNCTYQGLGDAPTAGSVAGEKVTFENKIQREQLYDLTYNGTLDGNTIKGDIAVAGVTGTFSGTRDTP